jgi:hypothetical protein
MEKVDSMPYKNPKKDRNYKKEYQEQKARGEEPRRAERQRARRAVDKMYTGSETKEAPERKGKDVAHVKALDKGGSNKQGVFLESSSGNRAFKRDSKGNLVSERAKGEKGGDKKLSKVIKLKK